MNPHRPSPLPSHPLFSTPNKNSSNNNNNNNKNDNNEKQNGGALSTLSAMLLGSKSKSQIKESSNGFSSLLSRRQQTNGKVSNEILNQDLGFEFLRPDFSSNYNSNSLRKRRNNNRSEDSIEEEEFVVDDLLDIPDITINRRRINKFEETNFEDEDEFDLPPSPVILPGGWNDDNKSLMLPAPFLDSRSSRDSFEGLLGTRQVRETSAKIRRLERALARDRPPPPSFPGSLFVTASKLLNAVGPPGGVSSGLLYRKWQDQDEDLQGLSSTARKEKRRLDTAERGLKGLEVGQRTARRWAEKLRKESRDVIAGQAKGVADILRMNELENPTTNQDTSNPFVRAATPLSLFDDIGTFSGFTSPPLPNISPISYLDHSPSTSPSFLSSTTTPNLNSLPPKPKIAPTFSDNFPEPSPFPLTFDLSPDINSDSGYFALIKDDKNDFSPLPLETIESLDDLVNLDNLTASSNPTTPLLPSSTPLSPIQSNSHKFITSVGLPFTFAFDRITNIAQNNFEFLVWILVGTSHPQLFQLPGEGGGENVAGLFGLLMHLFGFIFFLLVHSWALFISTYATLRSIILFSHWTYLNLTGQTDLSIVAKEYFTFCHAEWNKVAKLDGNKLGILGGSISFMEMAAIQAMSRERYLIEGPGNLVLLNGDDEEDVSIKVNSNLEEGVDNKLSTDNNDEFPNSTTSSTSPSRRNSFKKPERIGIARRKSMRAWSVDDREAESLIVTGGEDNILSGTIINDYFDPLRQISPVISSMSPLITSSIRSFYEELPPLDIGDALPGGFTFSPLPTFTQLPSSPISTPNNPPNSPPLKPLPEIKPLPALLKTIKRCVRLSTASYGLHSYVLAPPTPLFTPSGACIAQHIFSHLGGIDAKNVLHVAIQKDYLGVPTTANEAAEYEPQFYLLRDDLNSEIVCVIRGTQSLHDVKIDLEANEVDLELPSLIPGGEREIYRCHGGILAAARRLLNPELSALFPKLRTVMQENLGYDLVLTGHSLGAALAATIAILVSQYEPDLSTPLTATGMNRTGFWRTHSFSGLPVNRAVKAVAFALPTTSDVRLAHRCSLGKEALVISVSLSCDVVVRMGIPQVREVRRALGRLMKPRLGLFQTGEIEGGEGGTKRGGMEILKTWWKWKRAGGGEVLQEGMEKSKEIVEIERRAWEWRKEMDDFNHSSDSTSKILDSSSAGLMIPAGRAYHLDRLPTSLESKRRKEIEEAMEAEDDEEEEPGVFGLYEVKNSAMFYRYPHLEADLVSKHLPRFYLDAIESL